MPRVKKLLNTFLCVLFLLCISSGLKAQQAQGGIKSIISSIESYQTGMPAEKLYVQLNKSWYVAGDTIWFKAYLLNAVSHAYSPLSSKLYLELVNDSSKVVKRMAVPVSAGVSWGNLAIDDDLPEGGYNIRAYTNWMQNFGTDYFFYKRVYLGNPGDESWTVHAAQRVDPAGQVNLQLQLTKLNNFPLGLHRVGIRVMDGTRVLYKSDLQTSARGDLNVNFRLPETLPAKNLYVIAEDRSGTGQQVKFPLSVTRAANIDLQFMPESGSLVAGIPAHVGFKALGEDGKGIDIKGSIIDSQGKEAATFHSDHLGMGTLDFIPLEGEVYKAKLNTPAGNAGTYPLPTVKSSGIVMLITNDVSADSLQLTIYATKDLLNGQSYPLIAQSRGVVCYAANVILDKESRKARIAKALFASGIAHITLMDASRRPVIERLTFIDHHDNLRIGIQDNGSSFAVRDSVPLQILVQDAAGKPVMGSFSVSVTDDLQVKEPVSSSTIVSNLLLTSDLKGTIEDPAWYFQSPGTATWKALDALLLTQGWIGYDWKKILGPVVKPAYVAEKGNNISGQLTNLVKKPVSNGKVLLFSTGKTSVIKEAVTGADGTFLFDKLPMKDSISYVIQARTASGKTSSAEIRVNEFKPAVAQVPAGNTLPLYAGSDSVYQNFVNSSRVYQKELDLLTYPGNTRLLKEVKVRGQKTVKGSSNLNGAGGADVILNEGDLEKAGKKSLFDLLNEQVKGFRGQYVGPKNPRMEFVINSKVVSIVIDSMNVDRLFRSTAVPGAVDPDEHYNYIKDVLDYITAEDVKGIEVMYSEKYIALYNAQLDLADQQSIGVRRGEDHAYIEITTRSGQGPFMRGTKGIYVYRPVPLSMPKKFYQPRYTAKQLGKSFTDLRSCIFWQPSLVTNASGIASSSFYAAGRPGTYTIVVEGADLNGKVGCQMGKITIR